jgi:hypothetical protein
MFSMTTVTFRDGFTVSDDSNTSTTLRNGGHRTKFIPALSGAVQVAAEAKDWASKLNVVVYDGEYSAKEYAVGTTGAGLGSAKAWAIGGTLPGGALSAKQHADNAAASALTALNAPGTSATSTTSNIIPSTGFPIAVVFSSQSGKSWSVGQFVMVASSSSPANYMVGQITAYNSSTGSMTISVSSATNTGGSGTFSNWTISATALANVAGATLGASNIFTGQNTFNAACTHNSGETFNGAVQCNSSFLRYGTSGSVGVLIQNASSTTANYAYATFSTGTSNYDMGAEGGNGNFFLNCPTTNKGILQWNFSSNYLLLNNPYRNTDATQANEIPRLSQVKTLINQPVRTSVGALNIDLSLGTFFEKTITGASTITVSNTAAAGVVNNFVLELTNAGSNVTFGFAPKWQGGITPTLTTTGRDVLFFYSHDGGSIWTGIVLARDVK